MKKFKNEAKRITEDEAYMWDRGQNMYHYDHPSKYLFQWSRALQSTVAQALSKLFSGEFNESDCGIYKCEGGCRIKGVGDLVLGERRCYFDYSHGDDLKEKEKTAANLITKIVLEWDPMDPVESMLKSASEFIEMDYEEFKSGVENSSCGGLFGGNALSSFFNWNPFSEAPIDRDYERFCLLNFGDMTDKEVDQKFSDEDLGKELLEAMKKKVRESSDGRYVHLPMCCSPNRTKDGLRFWINTGRSTQIDGWKTEDEIREFLAGDGKLVD